MHSADWQPGLRRHLLRRESPRGFAEQVQQPQASLKRAYIVIPFGTHGHEHDAKMKTLDYLMKISFMQLPALECGGLPMLPIRKSAYALLVVSFIVSALYISVSLAQQSRPSDQRPKAAPLAGRATFNSLCAGCHGLDGSGSDKAVNISASSRVSRISNAELSGIISNGLPGTGMPAFHSLTPQQIRAVVGYLRSLQGKAGLGTLPGDPKLGKEIFFGKGDCYSCHAISGEGGFLGPDLTQYGATASVNVIRDEIVRSPRVPPQGYRAAVITTATGDRLEGLIRNEDNFTVQLQTRDGTFHLMRKNELTNLDRVDGSLMPTNYRERLSDNELNDLVSYLLKTPDPNKAATHKGKDDFE